MMIDTSKMSGADKVGLKMAMAFQVLVAEGFSNEESLRMAWKFSCPDIDFDAFCRDVASSL